MPMTRPCSAAPRSGPQRENAARLFTRLNANPVELPLTELVGPYPEKPRRECGRQQQTFGARVVSTGIISTNIAEDYHTHGGAGHVQQQPSTTMMPKHLSLGSQDVLVVSSDAALALQSDEVAHWWMGVAAHHALSGGLVTFAFGPGSGSLHMRALTLAIEAEVMASHDGEAASAAATVDPLDVAQNQQQLVLQALGRMDLIECHDVADVHTFCAKYSLPATSRDADGEASKTHHAPTGVPLVILVGMVGQESYLSQYERAAGESVHLTHNLFCVLHRRLKCAMIITEHNATPWDFSGTVNPSGFASRTATRHPSPSITEADEEDAYDHNVAKRHRGESHQPAEGVVPATVEKPFFHPPAHAHDSEVVHGVLHRSEFLKQLTDAHRHHEHTTVEDVDGPAADLASLNWGYLFLQLVSSGSGWEMENVVTGTMLQMEIH